MKSCGERNIKKECCASLFFHFNVLTVLQFSTPGVGLFGAEENSQETSDPSRAR
jgi:hypothetical protein